jgi:hypothetical protein
MSKPLLLFAAAFAVIFSLYACSEGSDPDFGTISCKLPNGNCIKTSEDDCYAADGVIGQCQAPTYEGYCVVDEARVCIASTEEECGFMEDLEYKKNCPSGYVSPKACHTNDRPYCEPIMPGYSSEKDCREERGTIMDDYGNCLRVAGLFTYGSCTVNGYCVPHETSLLECRYYEGVFVPNGSCPATVYGSCRYDGYCEDYVSEYECNYYYEGIFSPTTCSGGSAELGSCENPGSFCIDNVPSASCSFRLPSPAYSFYSGGTCSTNTYQYCFDSSWMECDLIGGNYIRSKAECLGSSFLVSRSYCASIDAEIEGIHY